MGVPIALCLIITILIGIVFGLLNGLMVSIMKLPAFIATLGTMMVTRGLGSIVTGTQSITYPLRTDCLLYTSGYQGEGATVYPGYYLTEGASGQDVTNLQTYLALIGRTYTNLPEIPVTGNFGPQTAEAVRAFQRDFGLPVTGSVGPVTWQRIAEEYNQIKLGSPTI